MRDAPASIVTMLEGTQLTLARCVKIILRDGAEFGFTDLDDDVEVPIATIDVSTSLYEFALGLNVGDIDLTTGFAADATELRIPLSDRVTRAHVMGRRFNQADVWIFDIDHSQDVPEPFEGMKGKITESRVDGGMAVFEVRSASDLWNVVIGGVLTPRCRADFGDEQCGMSKANVAAIVITVESSMRFTVDYHSGFYDDQYFRYGDLIFASGELDGVPPFEIVQSSSAGVIELLEPLPQAPEPGDTLYLRRGCSLLKSSDDPTVPTCVSHNNLGPNGGLRFRGFDRVPGSDVYLRPAIPGSG